MKTFIYTRVSTLQQDIESQRRGITKWLKDNNIENIVTLTDKVSGSVPWTERMVARIFEMAVSGDQLIVSELSRIGRSTADVLGFIEAAARHGIKIIAVKNAITLDGSINSTIIAMVMALAAEIERDFIRQRTKEGMEKAKANGKKLGRPTGKAKTHKQDGKAAEVNKMLAANVSKSAIARLLGVSRGTLNRFINDRKNIIWPPEN
jgi:DNA invertase Pin-like site-specific DNA recombinase